MKPVHYVATALLMVMGTTVHASAQSVDYCAEVAESHTGKQLLASEGEVTSSLFRGKRVIFPTHDVECSFDDDGLIKDLNVEGQSIISGGWSTKEAEVLFNELSVYANEEGQRLNELSEILLALPRDLEAQSVEFGERTAEDLLDLRRDLQFGQANHLGLKTTYLRQFAAPNLEADITEFFVFLDLALARYRDRPSVTVFANLAAPQSNFEDDLNAECEKLLRAKAAWRLVPEASPVADAVSPFEAVHQLLDMAVPAFTMAGIELEERGPLLVGLALSGVFRAQAKVGEEADDPLAHERAAYEWGYSVGNPEAVRLLRFLSEGLQLGVFSAENLEPFLGGFAKHLDKIQNLMGDFGTGYDINFAYLEDAFKDVEISKHGAIEGELGNRSGLRFEDYWKNRNNC